MNTLDAVFARLDAWVESKGVDGYIPADLTIPFEGPPPDHAIQQVREELYQLARVLQELGLNGTILEIGLGNHGGTHILWRMLFERVLTIEVNEPLVRRFRSREAVGDGRSYFIPQDCANPLTRVLALLAAGAKQVDCLFLDGDHAYSAVRRDYLLYRDFVRPGGLIVFHDSIMDHEPETNYGVSRFLKELSAGLVDGRPHHFSFIHHSRCVGIAYERQTAAGSRGFNIQGLIDAVVYACDDKPAALSTILAHPDS